MANFFCAIPAEVLEGFLANMRFERTVQGREVVYVRKSARNPDVQLKVYSSVKVGQTSVRSAGKDAIRICCVFDNGRKSFGIGKFQPVFRVTSVESVLARLKERLVEASKRANEWIDQNAERQASWEARRQADRQRPGAFADRTMADSAAGDIAWKNEFARRERAQEPRAVVLEPGFSDTVSEPPGALFG